MSWFFNQLFHKITLTLWRLFYYITSIPKRLYRLGKHLVDAVRFLKPKESRYWWESPISMNYAQKIGVWLIEFLLYILDLIGVGEVYGTLADWAKFNSRPLQKWEVEMAKSVYGDSLRYRLITVDEKAIFGFKIFPAAKAYVSYHTINAGGVLENGVLIHEFIHIWQYERFGTAYALRALLAQHSDMQYNYGGVTSLKSAIAKKLDFLSFNFEQQGDIIQDYYRIKEGYRPLWGIGKKEDLQYYEHFVNQLPKLG
jgi:hypothetical protein